MKATSGTIARTVVLAVALINQLLTAFGYNVIDISNDTINTLISTIFTIVTALVAFWKNNSFTKAALEADEVMKELKSKVSEENADECD
jgi:SPP1 family holin